MEKTIADRYKAWGLSVVPVVGKAPAVTTWADYQNRPTTQAEHDSFAWQTATGIGCITGTADVRCIDYDTDKDKSTDPTSALETVEDFLERMGLPRNYPWTVRTGSGGFHVWVRCTQYPNDSSSGYERKKVTKGDCREGVPFKQIELRWNQHTVLPPSVHPNGNTYAFLHGEPIDGPSYVDIADVLEAYEAVTVPLEIPNRLDIRNTPTVPQHTEQNPLYADVERAFTANGSAALVRYIAENFTDGTVYSPDRKGNVRVGTEGKGFGGYYVLQDTGQWLNMRESEGGGFMQAVSLKRTGRAEPRIMGREYWETLKEAAQFVGIDPSKYEQADTTNRGEQTEPEGVTNDRLAELLKQVFQPNWGNQPPYVQPVITLQGPSMDNPEPVGSLGNVTALFARSGTGKSSVSEALVANVINPAADSFGFRVDVPEGRSVVYIDTERDQADHHKGWRNTMRRAGIAEGSPEPERAHFFCFTSIGRLSDRQALLFDALLGPSDPETKTGAYGLAIIDGIGDFVGDVNDAKEVAELFDRLRSVANENRICVFVTLHQNPSQSQQNAKGRGHLGSEVERRAACVLQLEKVKDSDVRRITTDFANGKNRNGSDKVETFITWDKDERMFVTGEPPEQKRELTPKKLSELETIAEALFDRPLRGTDAIRAIMDLKKVSHGTAAARWKSLKASGLVREDAHHRWERTPKYPPSPVPVTDDEESEF